MLQNTVRMGAKITLAMVSLSPKHVLAPEAGISRAVQ